MDVYVWVFVCVCGWVAKERILSPTFLKLRRNVQKTFLCLLWREGHTKSSAREKLRDRKRRMKRVSQLGVRPRSGQSGAEGQSVESETPEHGVKTQSNEDDGQMSQHFW